MEEKKDLLATWSEDFIMACKDGHAAASSALAPIGTNLESDQLYPKVENEGK